MSNKKFIRKVLHASHLNAKGKTIRALNKFNKLRALTDDKEQLAMINFHQGLCEISCNNTSNAVEMLSQSAEYYSKSKKHDHACSSYIELGNSYCIEKEYDKACEAYMTAEGLTDNFNIICKIKALLSEARMLSDTVYDTTLFLEACEYIRSHHLQGKNADAEYFLKTCLMAAKACKAINFYTKAVEYGELGIQISKNSDEADILKISFECADIMCFCAVQTWDSILIKNASETAYKHISLHPFDKAVSDRIRLLYSHVLIKKKEIRKARTVLSAVDKSIQDPINKICLLYCECLCDNEEFIIFEHKEIIDLIPLEKIDAAKSAAESIIDIGFAELAAEIYSYSLLFFNECKHLLLRPLASLFYKLGKYSDSARSYAELTENNNDPILNRAYSLACIKSGYVETAKKNMLKYIEMSEDKGSAITLAAALSLDEGFPPDFSSSLYYSLTELLEKDNISTNEIVDAYNRLGICLYRSNAPLEKEMDAFKKAASHAEQCEATQNTNIQAVILCNLAECYLRKGSADECYSLYLEADKIFSAIEDIDLLQYSSCLKFISEIQMLQDNEEESIKTLKKAISVLEPHSQNDTSIAKQLSLCRNTLGTIYFRQGKLELEISELTKAIDLVKDCSIDDSSLALLYSNRGEAYECIGNYDLMAKDYNAFLSLMTKAEENEVITSDMKMAQAAKWLSVGRYKENSMLHDDAIDAYKNALNIIGKTSSDDEESKELAAFAYYQLGNSYCHHNIKNFSGGLDAYSRSVDILENITTNNVRKLHLASIYEARSAFYEIFGEHSLSVTDLAKADQLKAEVQKNL